MRIFHYDELKKESSIRLSFDLFPNESLQIQLLTNVSDPYSMSNDMTSFPPSNFALLNAERIVSVGHIAAAANHALLRHQSFMIKNSAAKNENKDTNVRGLAIETIICAGGSSHVGNVLRDFAFLEKYNNEGMESKSFTVIVLAWNCSEEKMTEYVNSIISRGNGSLAPLSYLSRERNEDELKDIIKNFKLTKEDIYTESSSLDLAIITRIATKFNI